jgi:ferric-dicitrate binding protein FerR (iron transport regulator)
MNLKWVEDPESYFAWMEGRLVFKNDPLEKVFRHIERIYDIEITYSGTDKSILQKEFSADLKTRSVTEVMEVIEMAMDIEYEVNGDRVIIN